MTEKPIAICVGHSRKKNGKVEGGAASVDRTSEWQYNVGLASLIRDHLKKHRVPSVIISDYEGPGYGSAMRWLSARIAQEGAAAAIELHFNSSDSKTANGHEWLYWHSSEKGRALAKSIDQEFRFAVPEITCRGTKPRGVGDRGAEFLRATPCPAVICEPGFGSSPWDWGVLLTKKAVIAGAIAEGIMDWQA
jgi:N-acetylmuramoyl-L-alanine amidase